MTAPIMAMPSVYRRAPRLVPGWAPTSLPNLGFWYDAADPATITVATGVSQWDDKSGNARHLLQGTGANQPATGTRTQNNRNVIDFDGTNDTLVTTATWTYGHQWTIYIVAKSDDGADSTIQHLFDGESAATAYGRLIKNSTNVWRVRDGSNVDRGTPDTSAHLFTVQFNGASSLLRIDGAQVGAAGDAGSNSGTVGLRLGADPNGPTSYFDGWIAEMFGYPVVHTAAQMASPEAKLRAKWAV